MARIIVTFRIKNDSGYQTRYESFTKKAAELADSSGVWEETTSFVAFKPRSSSATAESVCSDLYLHSDFDSSKDVMVVIDLDKKQKATRGEIKYPNTLAAVLGF